VAPLLILLFAIGLGWLPAGGWSSRGIGDAVLPVIALALPQIAVIARLMRASMIETLSANFIRTARAKGLPMRLIVWRHALRPAALPVLSYLGPAAAGIVTGSVVIEQVFGIPGIGRYFVQAALNRDYTLVLGVVIFYGALIILFNLAADLLHGLLDPRVRLG
jgi:oligopeptide transport system permease protein